MLPFIVFDGDYVMFPVIMCYDKGVWCNKRSTHN